VAVYGTFGHDCDAVGRADVSGVQSEDASGESRRWSAPAEVDIDLTRRHPSSVVCIRGLGYDGIAGSVFEPIMAGLARGRLERDVRDTERPERSDAGE